MNTPAAPPGSFRAIFLGGLPLFFREGFGPLLTFVIVNHYAGLGAGVAAATALSLGEYAVARRAGRDGLLVRLSMAFVTVQAVASLLSDSATVYLGAPVLANGAWGLAFLVSAAIGRPLSGALACAWYPFDTAFRESPIFRRVFAVESIIWGVYLLGRGALRLWFLIDGSFGGYLAVSFLTGTPLTLALIAWSIAYAISRLPAPTDDDKTNASGTHVQMPHPK